VKLIVHNRGVCLEMFRKDRNDPVLFSCGVTGVNDFLTIIRSECFSSVTLDDVTNKFLAPNYDNYVFPLCKDSERARMIVDQPDGITLIFSGDFKGILATYTDSMEVQTLRKTRILDAILEVYWILHVQALGVSVWAYFGSMLSP